MRHAADLDSLEKQDHTVREWEEALAWDAFRDEFYAPQHWGESIYRKEEQIAQAWEEHLYWSSYPDCLRVLSEEDLLETLGDCAECWKGRQP